MITRIDKVNNKRSPFTLNTLEGVTIILVITITEIGFYYGLQSSGLIPHADPNSPWMADGRQKMFSTFALPLGMILLIPAVSLVRSIRQDVRFFSRLGHLASTWPLLISVAIWHNDFILIESMTGLLWPVMIIGPIIAIIVCLRTWLSKRNRGDLLAIPVNVAWSLFYWAYLVRWGEAFIFWND